VRGNHESSTAAAKEFPIAFPQTSGTGSRLFGARDFSSPTTSLAGLSYSFKYNNATLVLLDQFTRKSDTVTGVADQIDWLDSTLAARPANTARLSFFPIKISAAAIMRTVFSGVLPLRIPMYRTTSTGACASNGVRYFMSGHDHMHLRSIMASPGPAMES